MSNHYSSPRHQRVILRVLSAINSSFSRGGRRSVPALIATAAGLQVIEREHVHQAKLDFGSKILVLRGGFHRFITAVFGVHSILTYNCITLRSYMAVVIITTYSGLKKEA